MIYNDCCLLNNLYLNSERIFYRLEYRFKNNSCKTSFDFKSFLPEQPSYNTKMSCSLLEFHPIIIKSIDDDDDHVSSESSEDEIEQISSSKSSINLVNDDYLNKLAEWEPGKSPGIIENDDDDEEEAIENDVQQMNNENTHADSIDSSTSKFYNFLKINLNLLIEIPTSQVEDLLVTFTDYPVKTEPMIYDNNDFNLTQLDGQTDFLFNNNNHKQQKQNKNNTEPFDTCQTISSENSTIHSRFDYLNQPFPLSESEKSLEEHMILNDQKLNTYRKTKTNNSHLIEHKIFPVNIPTLLLKVNNSCFLVDKCIY